MPEIADNRPLSRYEMHIQGETAFAEYERDGNRLILLHTEVPRSLSGKGIGSLLARYVLEDARRQDLRVVARCEFMAGFIQRHPEFGDLLCNGGK